MTGYAGNQNNGRGNAGLISIMLTPILIIAVALGIFIYNLVGTISALSNGGEIVVTQEAYDAHIASIEKQAIAEGKDKDGTIILTFYYDEDTGAVTPDMKAGTNLMNEVTDLLSNAAVYDSIKTYSDTFKADLVAVLNKAADDIVKLDLNSNYIKKYDPAKLPASQLVKLEGTSFIDDSDGAVAEAVKIFSEKTGIALVVSVDSSAAVFGRTTPWKDIIIEVALLAFSAYMIFNLIKKVRAYKQMQADLATQPQEPTVKKSPYYDDEEDEEEVDDEEADETEEEDETEE